MHFLDESGACCHILFTSMKTWVWTPACSWEGFQGCVVPQKGQCLPPPRLPSGNRFDASVAWHPSIFFWPQSPNSPDSLQPQNCHSLIILWKNVGRQLEWWEYSLLISEVICRNIIFVLFPWPLLAASKSRRGSLRERCERRSLEPASCSAGLGIQMLLLKTPTWPHAGESVTRNRQGGRQLKCKSRVAPVPGTLPID